MVYIIRDLEGQIRKYMRVKEIIAVVGPRQCGKTTMLNNLLKNLKKVNNISFDNVKQLKLFEEDIDSFIELHVKGYNYLFIDEVQYSKDSGKKLKYIYDSQRIKIIISGSSAADLSIHSLKYLVGRIFIFKLFPFSFREFLRAKDDKIRSLYEKSAYGKQILSDLNNYLKEYMLYGGYPRAVLTNKSEEKKKVLDNIYNTYLLREIKEILALSDNDKLINLIKSLSLQIGNMLNYNELSGITGFSFRELKRYLNILEETYICRRIITYHTNKRTELVKIPKIYFIDLGFRNMCIDNFLSERTDKEAIYENFVLSELIKENSIPKYWRAKSGAEVDFVIDKNKVVPIEIKSYITSSKTTRSFRSFISKYKPKKGYVLSIDFEEKKDVLGCEVNFMPFVKFLSKLKDLS